MTLVDSNLEKIKALRNAYKRTFEGDDGEIVLGDLKKICFYNTTTMSADPYVTAFQEGQRAVILHILTRMQLDTSQLEELGELNDKGQS